MSQLIKSIMKPDGRYEKTYCDGIYHRTYNDIDEIIKTKHCRCHPDAAYYNEDKKPYDEHKWTGD